MLNGMPPRTQTVEFKFISFNRVTFEPEIVCFYYNASPRPLEGHW